MGERNQVAEAALKEIQAARAALLEDARKERLYGNHMMGGVLETEAKGLETAASIIATRLALAGGAQAAECVACTAVRLHTPGDRDAKCPVHARPVRLSREELRAARGGRAARADQSDETTPDGPEGLRETIPIGPTRRRS